MEKETIEADGTIKVGGMIILILMEERMSIFEDTRSE